MTATGVRGNRVVIVAGPTCSGKSALALALAERLHGEVINADSMQVYRELRIITARPTPAEEAQVPHTLYGVQPAAEAGSAAWWREQALAAIATAHQSGRLPILCGGTGLYLAALTQGLAAIPDPGSPARQEARALIASRGSPALHALLAENDPDTAAMLRPNDSQRVARAWEVWRGTGRGLASWQTEPAVPPPGLHFRAILVDPPREALRQAIATRFAAMLTAGAVEEVRALLDLTIDASLPAMRAHGVPELAAFLRGEITLEEAEQRACQATSQYTKRQATWFRHRQVVPPPDLKRIIARVDDFTQLSQRSMADMQNFIIGMLDAPQHAS